MFGPDNALQCPPCAQGIRERMRTRTTQRLELKGPALTIATLAIAAVLMIAEMTIAKASEPAWLAALHQGPQIWAGQVWRSLSNIFMHGGIMHIAMNGMALWFLGRIVESVWGRGAYAFVLLGTGFAASSLSYMMNWKIGGVGLSGAIFGLAGFMWAQRRSHPVAAAVMTEQLRRGLIFWLVLGVVLSATRTFPIDNWAHGGGLAMGFLMGFAWTQRQRAMWIAACVAVILVVGYGSMRFPIGSSQFLRVGDRISIAEGERSAADWRRLYLADRLEWFRLSDLRRK